MGYYYNSYPFHFLREILRRIQIIEISCTRHYEVYISNIGKFIHTANNATNATYHTSDMEQVARTTYHQLVFVRGQPDNYI